MAINPHQAVEAVALVVRATDLLVQAVELLRTMEVPSRTTSPIPYRRASVRVVDESGDDAFEEFDYR